MNDRLTLHIDANPALRAGEYLNTLFSHYSRIPILFIISGGSALGILDLINSTSLDTRFTLGVLDERFSTDPKVNNFLQLSQTKFFKSALGKGAHTISTLPQEGERQEMLEKRLESSLHTWKTDHPAGKIIITQGIGPDGHTAGIMPYPDDPKTFEALFLGDAWVASYDATGKNQFPLRVTTTLTFLKEVGHSIVFIKGGEKGEILNTVLSPQGDLYKTPARIIHNMAQVDLFTDLTI
jgi:6-phosphogluconolactonase/glucosamine-6-phosphate isomerase/deaminase